MLQVGFHFSGSRPWKSTAKPCPWNEKSEHNPTTSFELILVRFFGFQPALWHLQSWGWDHELLWYEPNKRPTWPNRKPSKRTRWSRPSCSSQFSVKLLMSPSSRLEPISYGGFWPSKAFDLIAALAPPCSRRSDTRGISSVSDARFREGDWKTRRLYIQSVRLARIQLYCVLRHDTLNGIINKKKYEIWEFKVIPLIFNFE